MKILYLSLMKKPYDMIERGEKPEEYREKTAYWIARLYEWHDGTRISMAEARIIEKKGIDAFSEHIVPKHYDAVCFSYGYTKRRMTFEYKDLTTGKGRPEWGAPDHETFIIKLGAELL